MAGERERRTHHLISLTASEVMALKSLIGEYIRSADRSDVFIDATQPDGEQETTPEDLLRLLMEQT